MKIYAVRHGQTDLNAEERIQGCKSDLPLNDKGREQARELAETLKPLGIDLIVTSPLKRAMETADIIAEHLGMDKNQTIKGMRLYERDFGDYEGMLMSEVDINSLRRWTDNAPVPNGETIRELASRVFDFLDNGLKEFEEKIERERRNVLYKKYEEKTDWSKPYNQKAAHKAIDKAFKLADEAMKELPEIKILFVVHGHVLRTMCWYFNGLPENGEETIILTDNCGFYEFDTSKIPSKMKDYQIILDRQTIEEKLKRLAKSPYKASYTTCFAMCYMIGGYEIEYVMYKCPVCGKETEYNRDRIQDLNSVKGIVDEISKSRLKVDALIDEHEYCRHCSGQEVNNPLPILKIRFSSYEKYHEVKTGNYFDYKCLLAFIQGKSEYEGSEDRRHPLVDCIEQIVKMTGLCPEITESWRERILKLALKKAKAAFKNSKGILTKKETSGMEGDVEILHGYTKIDDEAFKDRKDITSVIIPSSVTSIGKNAFDDCGLSAINIPESVEHIGDGAFRSSDLISIAFPGKVTSIGKKMFEYCSNLESITIHDGITKIAGDAFKSCWQLKEINVSENNPMYSSADGILFDKEKKTIICYPPEIECDSYAIPDSVTSIAAGAFSSCGNLVSVTIPANITSIGEDAFWNCKNLEDINIPDSVVYIGKDAFGRCDKLSETAGAKIKKLLNSTEVDE